MNGASIVNGWRSSDRQGEQMIYDSRNKNRRFPCPETLCILEFKTEDEMLCHVQCADNHQYVQIKSGMDKALLYYAQQKHLQNLPNLAASSHSTQYADDSSESSNDYGGHYY